MDAPTSGSPIHCPAGGDRKTRALTGRTNKDWWPNQLSLEILHQNGAHANPMGESFDYA